MSAGHLASAPLKGAVSGKQVGTRYFYSEAEIRAAQAAGMSVRLTAKGRAALSKSSPISREG